MTILSRLLLLAFLASAPAAAATLAGTVKDPQGHSIAGGVVTLFASTGATESTTTDTNGAFRFDRVAAGLYLMRVEAAGFATQVADNITLSESAAAAKDVALQLAGVHETVTVTASGTPQSFDQVSKSITSIDQSDSDARDAVSLADIVALAPSLRVQQLGGPGAFASFQIRGLRTEDTAILVDGLRLRDASATQADGSSFLEDLLSTDASRIEILRGSGSSLYGTDAIGGVVNVITDQGGGRTRGSVLVEGGSLGAFRGRAQIAGGSANHMLEYSLGVSELDVTDGINGDAPYRDTAVQGRITFHLSPVLRIGARIFGADSFATVWGEPDILGSLTGQGIVNAIPLPANLTRLYDNGTPVSQLNTGNATFIPAPDNPDATRAARFLSAAFTLDGQPTPKFDYSLSYQLVSNGRRYGDGPAGIGYQPDGSTRALYDGRIQTVDAQFRYQAGRHNLLTGGYEFENENYASDTSDTADLAATSATNVTQRSHTVFAQDQAQFLDGRLQLSGAVRAQYFELQTPSLYPAASAPYQGANFPSPPSAYTGDGSAAYFFRKSGTKLRAHVGRGYRAPSLYERFGAGFDPVYGYSVYGDPHLKPEHSLGIDAGVDQTLAHDRLRLSGSYFYTWLENVINFDTSGLINSATDPFGRYIGYVNVTGGISRGFEVSAAAALTRKVRLNTAYAYVSALERTPIVGGVLQSWVIPKNQFSAELTGQLTARLLVELDALASSNYLAPIYGDVITQTYRFEGAHKINAGVSYRLPLKEYQAVRFFVRAANLFNQTSFENGFATPGRTATAGAQFEF